MKYIVLHSLLRAVIVKIDRIYFSLFYLFPFSVTDRPTTTFQVRLDPSLLSESFVHFDGQIRSQSSVTQSNMFIPFLLNTIKLYVLCL
jgi:hypothetical protein